MLPQSFINVWCCYFIADELEATTNPEIYYKDITAMCIPWIGKNQCLDELKRFYQTWDTQTIEQLSAESDLDWEDTPQLKGHLKIIIRQFIESLENIKE